MWKSLVSSDTAKGLTAAWQQTGDAVSIKVGTDATPSSADDADAKTSSSPPETPLAQRFQKGWGSVVEATKQAVDATREAVEKEQTRLFASTPVKRDPRSPLDVDALRDAEVVYITERIITMGHPALQSTVDEKLTPNRKLAAVAHLLDKRHGGRYMVWNLSEIEYDIDMFDDQVLTFSFPGSPSPPLGLLLKLLMSMESWLKADERNIAVMHCLTGKGRTSTVLAAFLCWVGEAGFSNVHDALAYIAKCKKMSVEQLTIPSQRRYVQYFANMLDGVRPSQPPLMLKRVLMSEAPKFAKGPPLAGSEPGSDQDTTSDNDEEDDADDTSLMGCAPYLQIFKAGELVFTTAASVSYQQPDDELPFCHVADGPISFQVDNVVQGDILLRARHLTASGQRVSMFRAAIHTGYVPPKVMRLSKGQLDGACNDRRFPNDFFLDLIFEPCDADMASKHLNEGKAAAVKEEESEEKDEKEKKQLDKQESRGQIVTASAYDTMLHRDSRFWDVIAARRQEHNKHDTKEEDPMWGPTIGRKRNLSSKSKGSDAKKGGKPSDPSSALNAFSIGGDLDFFDSPEKEPVGAKTPPKRDELMEALNALDDEPVMSPPAAARPTTPVPDDTEEIVFETEEEKTEEPTEPHPTIVTIPPKKDETSAPAEKTPEDAAAMSETATSTSQKEEEAKKTPQTSAVDEAAELLNDADLDVDSDLDALLASAGDEDVDLTDGLGDDLDFDEGDLEDLENLLAKATK